MVIPNAIVTVSTQTIPAGAIGILFSVKEGPKAVSVGPVAGATPPAQTVLAFWPNTAAFPCARSAAA